ncbi:putative ribonuclease H-like domain-containing protein, partial [Tanacetum coccineum]
FPDKVYKVEKALYGLHQAPRAWYETLSTYLLENGFRRGTIDKTLFINKDKGDILLVQVYVDDIIFRFIKKSLCVEFEQMMHKRFQMSSIGELTFFLGLQVKQKDDGIFISQDKYMAYILKKFDFATVKTASTLIETNKALLKDEEAEDVDVHLYRSMIGSLMYLIASRPDIMFVVCACARDSPFDLEAFFDSDYAGASLDKKSTTGGCLFLGKRLISWQCKNQTIVANSITEAEYVVAANCCGQVVWIQNQMLDYGFNFMYSKIHIDNESTICIVKNLVFHSKTKHIEIRHHFIRDSYEKRLIQVIKIHTDHNVVDLLIKAFDVSRIWCCWAKVRTARQKLVLVCPTKKAYYLCFSIKKFWQTATVSTIDNGEQEIKATVDGKEFTITEAFVRRHLQLADADALSYPSSAGTFQEEEGETQSPRQALNKDTELPQTSVPIPNVLDAAVHQERGDSMKRAATTAISLEVVQDSSNIAKTQSTATPIEPISQETSSDGGPRCQETMGGGDSIQARFERASKLSYDSPLGGDFKADKEVYGNCLYQANIMKVQKLEITRPKTIQARRKAKIVSLDERLAFKGFFPNMEG